MGKSNVATVDPWLSEPLDSQAMMKVFGYSVGIVWIIVAHTFIYRAPLKYSNRMHTYVQNTLIEQSFSIEVLGLLHAHSYSTKNNFHRAVTHN